MKTKAQTVEAVFTKPEVPRSDWEAFKWMFFEPSLLFNYSRTLSRRAAVFAAFRIYCLYIVPLILVAWLLWIILLICIDLPFLSPESFRFEPKIWQLQAGFGEKLVFLGKESAGGLAGGLALGLAGGLAGGLAKGLALGLAGGLASGLALGLAGGLAGGLAFGLALGLAGGLAGGLALGLAFGLALGLAGGLAFGLAEGLAEGLAFGLGFVSAFYIGQFRLIFYPFYWFGIIRRHSITNNPYINDEGIWLPLPWVKNALRREADTNHELAFRFVNFLLRYRQLQYAFAAELSHIATAARWKSALRLNAALFQDIRFLDEDTPKSWQKHMPSSAWRKAVSSIQDALLAAENQTAVVLRLDYYEMAAAEIEKFQDIHKYESFKGKEAYYAVIEHWKKVMSNQLLEVGAEVKKVESVSSNPYSKGLALSPKRKGTVPLFLDRDDIKERLTLKIQTSLAMPTLQIIGQRRVGKTSLLNFLPNMLPPSFVVATLDAQSMSGELSVPKWFREWRAKVVAQMGLYEPEDWLVPEDWLQAWDDFAEFLVQAAENSKRRIILVMDEYDEDQGFHGALRQDVRRGEALLARMRSFSQDQVWVVFMFVGATYFSDLPEPKMSKYFVHAHIERVEYLSREASLKLIERPIPNFELRYDAGVPEKIYELTVGHPHLLQSICSDLVDYANNKKKNPVGFSDLEIVIRDQIVMKGEMPFAVFWDEFCIKPDMRKAVLAISKGQPVDVESPEVRSLNDYGYLLPDGEGGYKMRVPLFGEWVIKFGY